MSSVQLWTLKGVMAALASFAAIRARRRTEEVGAAKAVMETILVLVALLLIVAVGVPITAAFWVS